MRNLIRLLRVVIFGDLGGVLLKLDDAKIGMTSKG